MPYGGVPDVERPVKAFLVERPHGDRRGVPEKASLEATDRDGERLLLKLPGGEEWWVRRDALEFVLRSVGEHLEHRRAAT